MRIAIPSTTRANRSLAAHDLLVSASSAQCLMPQDASKRCLVGPRHQLAARHAPFPDALVPLAATRTKVASRRTWISHFGARLAGHWTDLEELRRGQDGSIRIVLMYVALPLARRLSYLSGRAAAALACAKPEYVQKRGRVEHAASREACIPLSGRSTHSCPSLTHRRGRCLYRF